MFGHRSSRVWLLMMATAIDPTTIAYADAPRGVYWNDAAAPTAGATAALDSLGARRIHIWLNDQPSKHGVTCDGFKYADWWKGRDIRQFVQGLRSAGYDVVLTISPYARSNAYIDSLKAPLKIAADNPGVSIEYDLEANFTDNPNYRPPSSCTHELTTKSAESRLLTITRQTAPNAPIGITSFAHNFEKHQTLVDNADWVAPQVYTKADVQTAYDQRASLYPKKPIRFVLEIPCDNSKCPSSDLQGSQNTFQQMLAEVDRLHSEQSDLVDGADIFGMYELRWRPDISTYVKNTAGH